MKHILKEKIRNREAVICVIGIGYVGLPIAMELAKNGFRVVGIDRNAARVEQFNKGENYIVNEEDREFKKLVYLGKLSATEDFSHIQSADVIVICVPTSLTKNLMPDLQHVESAVRETAKHMKRGQLICIESTIYPGTTEEVALPILERINFKVEEDFYLCHSPERIDPGNQQFTTEQINKIVGGIGPDSLEVGNFFYQQIIANIVSVSSVRVAEMAKIYENTFRAVNIALANEFTLLCDKMGIRVWDVLDAAFTKPFGIMPFYPGPGVGGHCIPVDPHYLEWKAREYNFITKLIGIAGEINRSMPHFVRNIVHRTLNDLGIAPSKARVLIIGMAYKKDVNDHRESPSVDLAELLLKDDVQLIYHDPYIERIEIATHSLVSVPLTERNVEDADVVLIATDHSTIDYDWLVQHARKIIDTRNATRDVAEKNGKVVLI